MCVACLESGGAADAGGAGAAWSPELGHGSFGFARWDSLKGELFFEGLSSAVGGIAVQGFKEEDKRKSLPSKNGRSGGVR